MWDILLLLVHSRRCFTCQKSYFCQYPLKIFTCHKSFFLPKYTQKIFSMSDILLLPLHSTTCFTCLTSYICWYTQFKMFPMSEIILLPKYTQNTLEILLFASTHVLHVRNLTFTKVHSEDVSHVRSPTFARTLRRGLHVRSPTFASTHRRYCTCQKSYFCQSGTGSGGQTVAWCPQRTWLVERKWQTPGWKPWVCSQQGSVWSESWSAAEQWRWTGHQHIQVCVSDLGWQSKKRWNQIKTEWERQKDILKLVSSMCSTLDQSSSTKLKHVSRTLFTVYCKWHICHNNSSQTIPFKTEKSQKPL